MREGPLVVQAIQCICRVGFLRRIDDLAGLGLHAERQFIACDAGGQLRINGTVVQVLIVEFIDQVECLALLTVADPLGVLQIGDR